MGGGGGQNYLQINLDIPKGPFRTKNSMALESVVFCYRRSFSLSVPFSCLFCLQKQAFLSPLCSILLRPYRILSPYRNSLSVVFLVREGPLGRSPTDTERKPNQWANPCHVSGGVGLLWKPFRESVQNYSDGGNIIGCSWVYFYRPNLPEGCIDIPDQCIVFLFTGACRETKSGAN